MDLRFLRHIRSISTINHPYDTNQDADPEDAYSKQFVYLFLDQMTGDKLEDPSKCATFELSWLQVPTEDIFWSMVSEEIYNMTSSESWAKVVLSHVGVKSVAFDLSEMVQEVENLGIGNTKLFVMLENTFPNDNLIQFDPTAAVLVGGTPESFQPSIFLQDGYSRLSQVQMPSQSETILVKLMEKMAVGQEKHSSLWILGT